MKKIKYLVSIICTLAFTFVGLNISNVDAADTITIKRAKGIGDVIADKYPFTVFETTNGKQVYCMDVDKKPLESGQTVSYSKDGDAGLLYLLQNGYPNKSFVKINDSDTYITQAAIWWYLDESKLSDEFKNATTTDVHKAIPKYIKPLVAGAKTAKDNQSRPSITFTNNGLQLTLTKDKKYYESNYLVAAVVGAKTYNVSLTNAPSDAEVIDENGNIGTTMNSSEKFKVRIPASELVDSTNINVKVSATGAIQKAKIYAPSDTSYQRVVELYNENITVDKSVVLSLNPKKHYCEYTDNNYYGKNGNIVDEDTYNKECGYTCEYIDGKYYGKNGNEVDKNTYDSECGQEVVVPNTSANIILWSVGLGVTAIVIGIGIILYQNNNINKKTSKKHKKA